MSSVADVSERSIAELFSLAGRTAVITGSAQGLGKAIVRRLAEAGANVLLADIDDEMAHGAAAELNAMSAGRVTGTFIDVADASSVKSAAETAEKEFGGIDIWVNNAGIFPAAPLTEMPDELWEKVFAVNTRGVFLGSREAARSMVSSGRSGVIVNVTSLAGLRGIAPGLAAYVGSKHAVTGLTRQMALELAPQAIRVLAVSPSFMATKGNLALIRQNPVITEQAGQDIPSMFSSKLGRVGVPDDVARAVLFCASDMSLFMTGTTLVVDAGETA